MAKTIHGMCGTRIYRIWAAMKHRCNYPKAINYQNYGAKGIKVCEEWENDFKAFHAWAMANGYSDDLTIDRVENDKGYSPDNCRWATPKEQQNNTSYNNLCTHEGLTLNITQWAELLGVPRMVLYNRKRRGWDDSRIVTTPCRNYNKIEEN